MKRLVLVVLAFVALHLNDVLKGTVLLLTTRIFMYLPSAVSNIDIGLLS